MQIPYTPGFEESIYFHMFLTFPIKKVIIMVINAHY